MSHSSYLPPLKLFQIQVHGLEFETVSVEADMMNGSSIVTASVSDLSEFLNKLNAIKDENEYELEMLSAVLDDEDNCHFEY